MFHTAAYEATNAITRRYPPSELNLQAPSDASVDAAIASASRATLSQLVPSQKAAIDADFASAMSRVPEGVARSAGIAVGEKAAAAILDSCEGDSAALVEAYRPHTTPGVYVPTVIPILPSWSLRKPWVMTSANQFRPGPPPALTSATWARDFNEIKAIGGKKSNAPQRRAERRSRHSGKPRPWPPIYLGVVRSVANTPGREVTQNARFLAAAEQAMDDALIAVFDAKYVYNFWRPVTAIRNGDIDGNDATERDASWTPFIETPMHPEYPCAHCTVAGALGAVLRAELGSGPAPVLATTSTTAKGAVRRWTSVDDFVQEVSNARVYDGVHYRNSTEVGTALGKQVGELAVAKWSRLPQ